MSTDSPGETLSESEVIAEAEAALDGIKAMRDEIGKVIFGQEQVVENAIIAILSGGHALLVGVPGLAKTKLVDTLGTVLGISAGRIQFTPDLMPSDILGSEVLEQTEDGKRSFRFVKGPIFTQLLMADEINRANPRTQSALLQSMQENEVSVAGHTHKLPQPFHVLATQNPIEHEGTYRLPEAQLDRFLFKVVVDYPSEAEEVEMLTRFQAFGGVLDEDRVSAVVDADALRAAQAAVRTVRVEEPVLRYAAAIVAATRRHPALTLGGSPRATLALVRGGKAVAAMSGRDFATPDDLRTIVAPALRHRILLTAEREIEGVRPETVLKRIVEEIEVPR